MVIFTPTLLLQALAWLGRPLSPSTTRPESAVTSGGRLTGAAACEVQLCSDIGTSLLSQGGSAADALVGMAACVGTIASYHSGFGGGGFALVRSPDGSYESVDFRGAAPANINATLFSADPTVSTMVGGLSVLVPGELRGLEAIHRKHGRLPWHELLQPAIKLARDGFEINRDLFLGMNATKPDSRAPTNLMPTDDPKLRALTASSTSSTYNESFLITDPLFAQIFASHGELRTVGEVIRRPTYARTLEKVAREGADAFYTGELAEAIVEAVQDAGGVLELEDLSSYPVHSRPALSIPYRNHTIYTTQAPSSGSIVLSILNTLAGYAIPGRKADNDQASHRFVEAMKFGYGQRTTLGDPQYEPSVATTQHEFLLPSTAAHTRSLISAKRTHSGEYYDPEQFEVLDDRGTSAMTAADSSGLVISLTSTVNLYWGSRIMVPEWGVVLNDGMDDFSVEGRRNAFGYIPSPINFIKPRKRPLSSMSPTIVENAAGEFVLAVSSAGGSRIISAITQVVRNAVDFGMGTLQALAAPRLHDQVFPSMLFLEQDMPAIGFSGFQNETFTYLASLGHNATYVPTGLSVACAIGRKSDGRWDVAGDPRKFDAGGSTFPAHQARSQMD